MHIRLEIKKKLQLEALYFVSALALLCLYLSLAPEKTPEIMAPVKVAVSRQTWAMPVDKSFNLYEMSPTLFRSALPDRDNLELLQKLNTHTVISFIKNDDKAWLGNAPIRLVSLPMHADRVSDDDVLHALRLIRKAETQGPVLIHCKHGNNRTGLMSAMYRIVIQGWSKEEALDEMQHGGFGDIEDMTDATNYVRSADTDGIRTALAQGNDCTTQVSTCYIGSWFTHAIHGSDTPEEIPGK
ncbi:Tyrosine phosphatase family protein [Azotobacter beijerinckii]|uniref:Tyrosine phosphatase family protein n=2 Tax=Azotobacter beijerinckii TaxID=170623 RepID=A0A1H6Z131_9GAMM|nr:Tyrosine phosphatase family protein [Azotobacter beijerinckii]